MRKLIAFMILAFLTPSLAQDRADLVIFNANVRTLDVKTPFAQAVVVKGSRISFVGKNDEIRKFIGPKTEKIDARGHLVIPGFNDSHVHLLGIGSAFFSLDLRNVRSTEELSERIAFSSRHLPDAYWIIGSGLELREFPVKSVLDKAAPENPVLIYSKKPETAFVNSAALKLAGFDRKDRMVSGGAIERGEDGSPTGIISGDAVRYVRAFAPKLADKQEAAALETATNYAASLGVTSVQDVHSDDLTPILEGLFKSGRLKTRVYDCIALPKWKSLADLGIKRASGTELIRRGCLKHFSDGEPEAVAELLQMMLPADRAELQIAVHAIGSRANKIVLDLAEKIRSVNGVKDRRFRIEHAHRFMPEDLMRFSSGNLIASMQPHLFGGSEPYRSLVESKTFLAFGSDASITDFNPLLGIYAAVRSGDQAISVEEAVRAYTIGSAYAEFQENEKGTISVGKLADIVILSDNIFDVEKSKIPRTRVVTTVMDGKIVYRSN